MRSAFTALAVSAALLLDRSRAEPSSALSRLLQAVAPATCGGPQLQFMNQTSQFCDGTAESNTVAFEPCCPGGPTDERRRNAQAAGETCRVAETTAPYCRPDAEVPCVGVSEQDEMLLKLDLLRAPAGSESCCLTCSCLGDPECTSFGRVKNIEINCDGRRDDNCKFGRRACKIQKDRSGNRCLWLKDRKFKGMWSSLDEDGSPCQADYKKSGYPKMTMYQVPGFKFELTTADRGIIRDVTVTMGNSVYTLNSARCFEEGASAAAWTVKTGSGSTKTLATLPSGWVGGPAVMSVANLGGANANLGGDGDGTASVAEWPWRISTQTGVQVRLVCVRPLNRDKLSRIDVLSLVELNADRADGASAQGFCVDAEIPRGRATYKRSLRIHDLCTAATLPKLLNTCIEIFNGDCRPAVLARRAEAWCERADLLSTELRGDIQTCKDRIVPRRGDKSAKTAERNLAWTQLVVQLNKAPDVQDAVSLISQFGWRAYLSTHSDGLPSAAGGNAADSCIADVALYSNNEAGRCAQGVSVQYWDESAADWTEAFFVPDSKPPCGGQLRISGDQYPQLFTNRIRLAQCDMAEACLTVNQCAPAVGFSASVLFETGICNQNQPSCFNCAHSLPPPSEAPRVCVSEPDTPTRVGECVSCCAVDDVTNPDVYGGPLCRAVTLPVAPYCSATTEPFGQLCTAPTLGTANAAFELYLERDAVQISCCATCTTFGDPLGVSFSGARDKYILCDGRDASCAFAKNACTAQKDTLDGACLWNASLAGLPQRDVNVNGSPCQPASYDTATLLVYDINATLRVEAGLGERAIIKTLTLTVPEGAFVLTAAGCFDAGAAPGWTWSGTAPVDELFALQTPVAEALFVTQVLTHLDTGVMLRLKCLRSEASTGALGGERIDVQALIETSEERLSAALGGGASPLSGFCATGSMNEKTPQNANAQRCRQRHVLDAVQMCSALADPACAAPDLRNGVRAWCARAALTSNTADCTNEIFSSNSIELAERWTEAYCRAVASMRPSGMTVDTFVDMCSSEVELDGIDTVVSNYGDGTQQQTYCAVNHTAYKPRVVGEEDCATGLSLQTQNAATLEWEELFFIPDTLPPCEVPFKLPATPETLPLFTRRVRLLQCDLDSEACPITNRFDTHCLSNQGFEVAYRYTHDAGLCPTI